MPNTMEFIADRLPRVTVDEVRRFADTVEIRDAAAFAAGGPLAAEVAVPPKG